MLDRLLTGRSRLPRFVNRLIDAIADSPGSLVGRVAAQRYGHPPADDATPVLAADFAKPVRVLIAPVNYSDQARQWARSLEAAESRISARNLAVDVPGGFDFPSDLVVPVRVYQNGRSWQRAQWEALAGFTHVLVEAEEPIVGRLFLRDVAREVAGMRDRGVSVAFLAHGTDLRLPSRHRESTPWSPYHDAGVYAGRLETLALRNLRVIEQSGGPAFVSTPDLLADLPSATWCPVVVDARVWREAAEAVPAPAGPLRVVHSPSSALMKGTTLIAPVLEQLAREGVVRYQPALGVAAREMPGVVAAADVLLDQFRLGSYGVAACEAMAAGRVVVGHVLPEVRAVVRRETGLELPIVEATPDTLDHVLRDLAARPELRAAARESGPAFVAAVHDGRLSAARLLGSWIDAA